MKKQQMLYALCGAAFCAILMLYFSPATHWIVNSELGAIEGKKIDMSKPDIAYDKIAISHPNDYQIALTSALYFKTNGVPVTPSSATTIYRPMQLERLHNVAKVFPSNPSIYAMLVRIQSIDLNETRSDIYIAADSDNSLINGARSTSPAPEILENFINDARDGERLDSDNAFFPTMSAYGYFLAHKDKEALDAIHRAAQMHRFDNYANDELLGLMKANQFAMNTSSGYINLLNQSSIQYPELDRCRAVGRMGECMAISNEMHKQYGNGMAIRKDIANISQLMCLNSTHEIGVLVGAAIGRLALSRPEGIHLVKKTPQMSIDEVNRLNEQQFYVYLTKIGRNNDVEYARKVFEHARQYRSIIKEEVNFNSNRDTKNYINFAIYYCVGFILIIGGFWFLILGLICVISLLYFKKIDEPVTSRFWMPFFIGFVLSLAVNALLHILEADALFRVLSFGIPIFVGLVALLYFISRSNKQILQNIVIVLITTVVITLLYNISSFQLSHIMQAFGVASGKSIDDRQYLFSTTISTLLLLILLSLVFISAAAYSQGKQLSLGRLWTRFNLFMLCLLTFAYSCDIILTVRADRNIDGVVRQKTNTNVLQRWAVLSHQAIPEPVEWR